VRDQGHEVLRALERSGQAISRHLALQLRDKDLTEAEAHVLFHVAEIGPETLAGIPDLNRAFGMRPSTLTSVLDRLQARELIDRRANPADRRSWLIDLTAAGREKAAEVAAVFSGIERSTARAVRKADMAGFRAVIAAVEDACR
jgi:MarR family transcriptional regulator, organic hydroperoxide resistance regulator